MVYRHILNFWPLVPAVDLQAIYDAVTSDVDDQVVKKFDIPFEEFLSKQVSVISSESELRRKESINILIIGDGLGCLIKTLSRMYRHETLNLNIYVVCSFPESLVRGLLLLSLLNDFHSSTGILEKAEIFLEIFGNTFLRASTSLFVETQAADMLDDIASSKQPIKSVPIVSTAFLKQREIDEICQVLLFLKNKECAYDASKAWENALRSFYGVRYDSRKNLFDYNYNMKLSQYPIINLRKYLEWCETGVAFKLRKGRYDIPNKTLCINCITKKISTEFCGDIATSPYIAFGVECKNDDMFKTENNQYVHTSEDISKFNIIDFMTEFSVSKRKNTEKQPNVHFLLYPTFRKTKKFEKLFDAVYVTCDMTNHANNGAIERILDEKAVVVFETVNNVVNSTKEHKMKHVNDITRLAEENNLTLAKSLTCFENNLKVFVRKDKCIK